MGEIALVVSGASGSALAARFARAALECPEVSALHVVLTGAACKVLRHEMGDEWATPRGFCHQLGLDPEASERLYPWADSDLMAPIASGSHLLAGTVILPCSAGMAGSVAHGISRGLGQRAADVAIKQGWPLLIGIRETPMSEILLDNLHKLARAGARIVPPLPAFYLNLDTSDAMERFAEHYCMRLLDLLGIHTSPEGLRWRSE
jgi:4-hydroxy-3-polyprenylbenzoate decarboxylase